MAIEQSTMIQTMFLLFLEIQVEGSKSHSLDIEKSNEKLHGM